MLQTAPFRAVQNQRLNEVPARGSAACADPGLLNSEHARNFGDVKPLKSLIAEKSADLKQTARRSCRLRAARYSFDRLRSRYKSQNMVGRGRFQLDGAATVSIMFMVNAHSAPRCIAKSKRLDERAVGNWKTAS
jgi:hypothetical protein